MMTTEEAKAVLAKPSAALTHQLVEAGLVLWHRGDDLERQVGQAVTAKMSVAMPDGRTALAVNEIVQETIEALAAFGPLHSVHEGIGLLDEEFNKELKDEAFKKECRRDPNKMRMEAKQVASLALRFMIDCCDTKPEPAAVGCVGPAA